MRISSARCSGRLAGRGRQGGGSSAIDLARALVTAGRTGWSTWSRVRRLRRRRARSIPARSRLERGLVLTASLIPWSALVQRGQKTARAPDRSTMPASPRRRRRRLSRSGPNGRTAFANMLYKGVSVPVEKGTRLLLMLVAAPALGAAAFGCYQFAATLTALLMLGTEMGLGVWTTRTLARDRVARAGRGGDGGAHAGPGAPPYAAAIALAIVLVGPGDTRVAIALLAPIALGNAVVDYAATVFRGFERFQDEAGLNVVRALLTAGAGLRRARARGGRSVRSAPASSLGTAISAAGAISCCFSRRYRLVLGQARGRSRSRGRAERDRAGDPALARHADLAALFPRRRAADADIRRQRRDRRLQRRLQDLRGGGDHSGGDHGRGLPAAGARARRSGAAAALGASAGDRCCWDSASWSARRSTPAARASSSLAFGAGYLRAVAVAADPGAGDPAPVPQHGADHHPHRAQSRAPQPTVRRSSCWW